MATVLLKARTNDEWVEPRAEFAIVGISPAYAQVILGRMDAAEGLEGGPGGLFCVQWWDYAPEWHEWDEEIDFKLERGDIAIFSKPPAISSKAVEQDATVMRVCPGTEGNEADVKWVGYVKHTTAEIETVAIKRSTLRRIADGRA